MLSVQPFVFQNGHNALKMTAKRYTNEGNGDKSRGYTLLLAHCIGAHKEQWEHALERIFQVQEAKCTPDAPQRQVREAWSFDWQNHGDAAILNYDALIERDAVASAFEWADAIAAFVKWLLDQEPDHRLVAIGHSAGAGAMTLATKSFQFSQPTPYHALILVEPTIVTRELFHSRHEDRMDSMNLAVSGTLARRDTWNSLSQAREYFKKRWPWNLWNERVLQLYCDYGLRPTFSKKPGESPTAVMLKCSREQEALSFSDSDPHFESAVQLSRISSTLPVHLVWAGQNDLLPEFIQDSLSDEKAGRYAASITRVADAGHLVVQEQPERLADVICTILDGIPLRHTQEEPQPRSITRLQPPPPPPDGTVIMTPSSLPSTQPSAEDDCAPPATDPIHTSPLDKVITPPRRRERPGIKAANASRL